MTFVRGLSQKVADFFSYSFDFKDIMSNPRVCVIGAGPSGMSALYQYNQLNVGEKAEVICYEKQSEWGGLWNYTWRTGTDEFGEVCHNGMYEHLWTNAPKECFEMADYTLKEHFDEPMPSFLPRELVRDYMQGRWNKFGMDSMTKNVKFNHAVRFVKYNKSKSNFTVTVSDLKTQATTEETFTHVIIACGIFSTPHTPSFPGIGVFQGRIVHAHDFRKATEFKGQNILVVGGSYSAEDVSVQCMKYGAKSAMISVRNALPGYTWPKGIQERPGIKQIKETSVVFNDNSKADIDAIVLCTGYLYNFPFLEGNLKLESKTSFYPDNLYKGVVWTKAGDNRLFYIGAQNQVWSLPMFDIQAAFIWRYITGSLKGEPKSSTEMSNDIQKWLQRLANIACRPDAVNLQADYIAELIKLTDRKDKLARDIFMKWLKARENNIGTFRDQCYASVYTGQMATKVKPWMENFEEGMKSVVPFY